VRADGKLTAFLELESALRNKRNVNNGKEIPNICQFHL